jgi:hypothetical protein
MAMMAAAIRDRVKDGSSKTVGPADRTARHALSNAVTIASFAAGVSFRLGKGITIPVIDASQCNRWWPMNTGQHGWFQEVFLLQTSRYVSLDVSRPGVVYPTFALGDGCDYLKADASKPCIADETLSEAA